MGPTRSAHPPGIPWRTCNMQWHLPTARPFSPWAFNSHYHHHARAAPTAIPNHSICGSPDANSPFSQGAHIHTYPEVPDKGRQACRHHFITKYAVRLLNHIILRDNQSAACCVGATRTPEREGRCATETDRGVPGKRPAVSPLDADQTVGPSLAFCGWLSVTDGARITYTHGSQGLRPTPLPGG